MNQIIHFIRQIKKVDLSFLFFKLKKIHTSALADFSKIIHLGTFRAIYIYTVLGTFVQWCPH